MLHDAQIELELGQDAQLLGQARQKSEFEVRRYPVRQEVMTVALEQAEAPVAQLEQLAVLESKYVPLWQLEHFDMPLATTQVRQA